jgi:hypothetical protein
MLREEVLSQTKTEDIAATCFGPNLGPLSGSIINYVSCFLNFLICIHISIKSVISNSTSSIVKIQNVTHIYKPFKFLVVTNRKCFGVPHVFFIFRVPLFCYMLLIFVAYNSLWSSDQSSCLQILRSGFNSLRYQISWEVLGLKRGPLSLVNTIEELLGRNSSGSGVENREYGLRDPSLDHVTSSMRKSWH